MASGIFTQRQVQREVFKGSWVNTKVPSVEYLVIAGGGAGGNSIGGGGGAGGLLQGHISVASGTPITVTVGAGGSNSQGVNSAFSTIIATGGGKGGAYLDELGRSGGSGGGGSGRETSGVNAFGGSGISGQGNAGGIGFPLSTNYTGAGGGGAGIIGRTAINNFAGVGGDGIASDISGNRTMYAGGGGGGTHPTGTAGTGGAGGGGAGTASGGGTGVAGTANLGGGGGGSTYNQANGGAGGSGVVIISYPDTYANAALQTNGTFSTTGAGSILFNGSSQYLSTSATQIIPATGDFTIEAWIYPTSFSGSPVFCGQGSAGDAGRTLFFISTGGVPTFTNGSSFTLASTGTVSLNTWTYISFTRSGNTGTWYINGAAAGTGSLSGITIQDRFVTIGGSDPLWTAQYFTGNISNFRISTVARTITSAPTAPFDSSTTNTKMLLSTVSGSFLADTSTNAYTFTNNGNASWNQLSPFPTGLGYKDRVYTWTSSGTITF
jgi:hypothetical protein